MHTSESSGGRPNLFIRGINRFSEHAFWRPLLLRIRSQFVAGIIVVVPLLATLLILKWLFEWVDDLVQPIIRGLAGRPLYGAGFAVTLVVIYIAGVITTHFGGQRLLRLVESLIARVPIVRPMYNGIKQVLESFAAPRETGFMQVVLVEFPRKGMRAIGFITNEGYDASGEKVLNVFVPTAPNPTSGFLQIVHEEDIVRTDISVDDAVKMVVSAGRISANRLNRQLTRSVNTAAVRKAPASPSSDDTA
jgi:uncharacterized membrane protein